VVGARVFSSVRPWARKAMGAVSVAVSVAYGAASHDPGQGSVFQHSKHRQAVPGPSVLCLLLRGAEASYGVAGGRGTLPKVRSPST